MWWGAGRAQGHSCCWDTSSCGAAGQSWTLWQTWCLSTENSSDTTSKAGKSRFIFELMYQNACGGESHLRGQDEPTVGCLWAVIYLTLTAGWRGKWKEKGEKVKFPVMYWLKAVADVTFTHRVMEHLQVFLYEHNTHAQKKQQSLKKYSLYYYYMNTQRRKTLEISARILNIRH